MIIEREKIQNQSNVELAIKYSIENDPENTFKYMNQCILEGKSNVVLEYAAYLYKTKHFKESLNYFMMLSKINHPIAQYYIGIMKYYGQGCKANKQESQKIMKYLSNKDIDKATEFIEDHFNK